MSVSPAASRELLLQVQELAALADRYACPAPAAEAAGRDTRPEGAPRPAIDRKEADLEQMVRALSPGDRKTGDKLAQIGAATRWASELGVVTLVCAECDLALIWDAPTRSLDKLHTLERDGVRCRALSPAQALDNMYASIAESVAD